jgi:hypothetical protein
MPGQMSALPIRSDVADPAQPSPDEATHLRLAERRRSERVGQMIPGWMSAPSGRHTSGREILILDLSLHGVGFITERPCDRGDRRWILVQTGPLRLSTRMQVVACRQREDGRYEVGGEFY